MPFKALEQITISIPSLLPTIQNRLLECISAVLSQSYHAQAKPSITSTIENVASTTQQISELGGSALVQIGLQTLAQFNFKGHDLLEFARDSVVVYLEDEDAKTRKDAALCCCKSVSNSFSGMLPSQYTPGRPYSYKVRMIGRVGRIEDSVRYNDGKAPGMESSA
ncbi:Serine/threonine-protein kinase TOR-like [Heracleum sosnowskyi]|uniref:Serine/threonine-protein kinase TOR-like n=1 Tax=Heracleum sosnowskyi TaxID=360622 RepID=A0AAD8MBT2_9APIA|nr:Serine/threonine-protein kinase TOR-like [Heracleum sosnowskyi]